MVEIFSGTYLDTINIKNLLENENISVFTANEYMSSIQPWTVSAGGQNSSILKVQQADYDRAEEIINKYISGEFSLEL
ncbi:putative signal transducing protein [Flavobacterium denitrificans]|uniref:putative signal transducing protein n=1 Tax=Flavobacterium denitrificans TaxID=281361 RepID=UPI000423646C|nr:DUF2007 domain-containing protein [Flavobacterium denitrificans]